MRHLFIGFLLGVGALVLQGCVTTQSSEPDPAAAAAHSTEHAVAPSAAKRAAMETLASSMSPDNAFRFGAAYASGKGVRRDLSLAVVLLRSAADRDHATAQATLGAMYEKGAGVAQDYAVARRYYRKSAEQGDEVGQMRLGQLYLLGRGVDKDPDRAREWIERAVDQGYSAAEAIFGQMHLTGAGVERDVGQALLWFARAAATSRGTTARRWSISAGRRAGRIPGANTIWG